MEMHSDAFAKSLHQAVITFQQVGATRLLCHSTKRQFKEQQNGDCQKERVDTTHLMYKS